MRGRAILGEFLKWGGVCVLSYVLLVAVLSPHCFLCFPIEPARMDKAVEDVAQIEDALRAVCVDAGVARMGEFFDPAGVRGYVRVEDDREWGIAEFARAQQLYTRSLYALLRAGRQALDMTGHEMGIGYASVLREPLLRGLGVAYLPELGLDPWSQNLYQIWPGPWDAERLGPVPFRVYGLVPGMQAAPDCWTIEEVPTGEYYDPDIALPFGYPAPEDKVVYVWCCGANLVSNQAIAGGACEPGNYARQYDWFFRGGGDDINNWDAGGELGRVL